LSAHRFRIGRSIVSTSTAQKSVAPIPELTSSKLVA
jgi:hypothetical protein